LADFAGQFKREEIDACELIVGMKCGGSDGLSGITANPTVGRFSDRLISLGGSTVLTEVPEMFGAESILFNRCKDSATFHKAVCMVDNFKKYFVDHGQVVYENPSPGNKAGGITTLEDKSCGCVQKGGSAQISDVLEYAEPVKIKGLSLLSGPGNDMVSTTDLTAAGAHLILFTTGRGTPFGAPVPTVKISTNTALYEKKGNWIDFNAGKVAEGKESLDEAGDRLLDYVLDVASGQKTRQEDAGYREISIFKDGVTL
jgi:altronate hydrolase